VSAALTAFGSGLGSEHAALTALASSRLLVPIIAVAGGEGEEPVPGGPARGDRNSEMSLPTLIGRDGRRAIPAFTCLDTLARWRGEARPVPAPASQVCRAAVDDECAVVVDIAGPVPVAIDGARLAAIAHGQPVPLPHEDPDVLAAVQAAAVTATGQQVITGLHLAVGRDGNDLHVLVTLGPGSTPGAASETIRLLGAAVMAALGDRLRRGIAIAVAPVTPVTPPAGPPAPRPPEPARRSWSPGWRRRARP
jgi:SseB protein N-terminal domain